MKKPYRIWLCLFAVWLLVLSGGMARLFGPPGAVQLVRLKGLLTSKETQLKELESQVAQLEEERDRLEKNRMAQEREIRKTLGYAASDELIFDFSASDRVGAM